MDGVLYLYGCNCTCCWLLPAWAYNGRKGEKFVFVPIKELYIYFLVILYLYKWNLVFVWMEFCIWMDGALYFFGSNCTRGWLVPALADNGRKGEIIVFVSMNELYISLFLILHLSKWNSYLYGWSFVFVWM